MTVSRNRNIDIRNSVASKPNTQSLGNSIASRSNGWNCHVDEDSPPALLASTFYPFGPLAGNKLRRIRTTARTRMPGVCLPGGWMPTEWRKFRENCVNNCARLEPVANPIVSLRNLTESSADCGK